NKELYKSFLLPKRSTKNSAGYDFKALTSFTLKKGERKKIPLGVKASLENDEVLMIVVRSSMGFKYNIRLCNQVGIIDSDYYNNSSNEGHIWICLENEGEEDYSINEGDNICQGIFVKYLTVDNEEDVITKRNGGFGSTNN
ncbi:MAG: dUTP diphosphatase, partial [Bacilli bacterium]|nr:dUTP diphosphatase [Bacilli bacterium]